MIAAKPLACTTDQFDGIHECLEHVRSTSATVKIDRQALVNLLLDHSALLRDSERSMRGGSQA